MIRALPRLLGKGVKVILSPGLITLGTDGAETQKDRNVIYSTVYGTATKLPI
ncbi:MAG: hypothetical protein Ct9H300mP11_22630 [Chloroflexota bacterium]|nr:MAG: hypothetical protein Ct9H300mP11_22630 [Chloroflexota bacterium]